MGANTGVPCLNALMACAGFLPVGQPIPRSLPRSRSGSAVAGILGWPAGISPCLPELCQRTNSCYQSRPSTRPWWRHMTA